MTDYREELTLALSFARRTATSSIQQAQRRYKKQYDRNARPLQARVGDWVLVRFPADESGKNRKLSRPWHGPFRVTEIKRPNVEVSNVYFPQDPRIMIHQSRVKACPCNFPGGFYWYGRRRRGLGKSPQWVEDMLTDQWSSEKDQSTTTDQNSMYTLNGEREMVETGDHDLEDEDESTSESEQPDVETSDELTITHDDCQQTTQSNASHPVMTHRRNTVSYNLRRHPQPSYKVLDSQARD